MTKVPLFSGVDNYNVFLTLRRTSDKAALQNHKTVITERFTDTDLKVDRNGFMSSQRHKVYITGVGARVGASDACKGLTSKSASASYSSQV